ncbi:rotatin-like [Mercenaria mercenaria]|uniref:rotatin-like n=1 Tax=Mercenaria mercenaria TaxID=6596 RepID=UPI00234E5008|nr:rotatin-like [Mercenaria mercenaria]
MRHRGDGRDGDTSASSTGSSRASSVGLSPAENEQMDFEDMQSLQFIQMTIPQFCALVLEKSLPLLKTNDDVMSTEAFNLLNHTLEIIVAIVTPELWQDNTMAARDCSEKFIESLDVLADLLKYHHHSNMPYDLEESTVEGPSDLVQHRLAYIGLSVFLGKFLKLLVPTEKSRGIISENLLSAINMMVYDECLSNALPDLQVLLLGYIKQLDEGRYNVYVSTATICQSLQKTCKFLTLCQEEASRLSKDTLAMCEGAFICLPYHRHLNYVTEIIKLCSDVSCLLHSRCSKSQHYETLQNCYRKLVLKCLSHPVDKLRLHAYTTVLHIVQAQLSVSKASDPSSTSCLKVKFIINADILYEIVVFGLADKDAKVASCATDIMCHLLKSQLLMSTEMWQAFLQSLMRGLPILQNMASVTSTFIWIIFRALKRA